LAQPGRAGDTPEFRGWLEREFPSGAAQLNGDEWSRRGFLKLMGARMALAGFWPNELSPAGIASGSFSKSVEWTIRAGFVLRDGMPRRTGGFR